MQRDPLAGSSWSTPQTVAGFAQSQPNPVLMQVAEAELRRPGSGRALDIGCGAGRNAAPLARQGWQVIGIDLSWPMVHAAARRGLEEGVDGRLQVALAPMDRLPARESTVDLLIAHGIWNLARSAAEFRRAVREAARVAAPGAALFIFTFSRHTFPAEVEPVAGEPFVFTEFSGQPQCFLTENQLRDELGTAGFALEPGTLTEYNLPKPGALAAGRVPVIYEAVFRYRGRDAAGGELEGPG